MKKNKLKMTLALCFLLSPLVLTKDALAVSIPSAPTDLTAYAASSSEISLDWDSVSGATYYYVYRSTSSSGTYTKIATTSTSSFTDTDLSDDTTYYYKVISLNSAGSSAYSSRTYATTEEDEDSDDLSAPKNLTAEAESSSEIYLDWDSVSGAKSYYVYRSKSSSGTYSKIGTTSSSNYSDDDLDEDTTYYYKVRAVNGSDTSDYSSKAYDTTDEDDDNDSDDLSAPKDLTAEAEGSDEINLDWDSVSDADSYYVYRATSSSGTYSKIGTTSSSNYTDDDDLEEDTTYYYKVRAVDGSDMSDYSSKAYATTNDDEDEDSDDLSAPKDLTAEAEGSDEINLDWDSVSDADSYYVYRATSSSGTYSKIGTTSSSNYTDDDDLEEDTTYYYKVRAVDGSDMSDYSSKAYATTNDDDDEDSDDLSAPEDLTAEAEDSNEIYLEWDSVSDADSYYVYRSTSSSGTYSKIGTTSSSNYTDDDDLEEDTTYYYKVRAVDGSDMSDYSSKAHATTDEDDEDSGDLSAPEDLTAEAASSSVIYLDWASVSDAESYYVYTSTSSSGTYNKIATTATSSYTDTNLSANTTYYYKVRAVNGSDTSDYSARAYATTARSDNSTPTTPTNPSTQIQSERLAGEDLYGTAAEVAKAGWNTSYYAIIVSGDNYTDALCSAPLARKYNAPLLLTTKNTLNEQTKTQLERLEVKKVIIIGGTGIISSEVEQSIKAMDIGVTRIAGNDRYDTSIKIAQAMGDFDQAVVASGVTFPDALSIAPIAAMKGMPILLTPKDELPSNIEAFLTKNAQSTIVVGGTGVISENVLKQLPSPRRLSGLTRYDTNISIIKEFEDDLDFTTCYVSTGENYADALAGSVLASLFKSPLILVSDPVDQVTIDYFRSKMKSVDKEVIFGGIAVVPNSILINIDQNSDDYDTPSAPEEITATTVSSSQINLTWDSVSGATSYYVYGATSSSGTYTRIATVTTASYKNTGLWADTTYYYKVQAVNSAGSSPFSPVESAKTDKPD